MFVFFSPSDPRNIIRWLDEKKIRFASYVPELLNLQKVHETQEAEVFEGLKGLRAMCYKFIEDAKKGEDYLFLLLLQQ